MQQLDLKKGSIIQLIDDPKQIAKVISKCFVQNNIEVLQWCSQSPDFNQIKKIMAKPERSNLSDGFKKH